MYIHEYQAKQLLAKYHIPFPECRVSSTPTEAVEAAKLLGGTVGWMIKGQAHTGARGKAGYIKYAEEYQSVQELADSMIGSRIVTNQTGPEGLPVNKVLVSIPCDIEREIYLSIILDRTLKRMIMMVSSEGGVDIEHVAANSPEKIIKEIIDPFFGLLPYQIRNIGDKLGLTGEQLKEFMHIALNLSKLAIDMDLSILEINPLVIDKTGKLFCLDAKIVADDSALYRQKYLMDMLDVTQLDPKENAARKWDLNYIALDGNIGCMVNGAGLAMATMDIIKLKGGNPANFLDVGGTATKERVTAAFNILTSDHNVKGILVNIFGGIVRCDVIANGIIEAVKDVGVKIPVAVRLEGNNADIGLKMFSSTGLNVTPATSLENAAEVIVNLINSK